MNIKQRVVEGSCVNGQAQQTRHVFRVLLKQCFDVAPKII